MRNREKIIISIVLVVAIIALVGGGTYAYWTWVSNSAQQTSVNFNTPQSADSAGLAASIEGNGTASQKMKPTPCTTSTYAINKTFTITYKNETEHATTLTTILSVTGMTIRSGYAPSAANLGYLKWAIRSSAASNASESTPDTCTSGAVASGTFNLSSPITFSGTNASNLPKQLGSFTIPVAAGTEETSVTYYLYIWLDYTYMHENVGNVNNDPMQGINVTTQLSGTFA